MSINNHVVSLEIAKELEEAGFPQESEFWWINGRIELYKYICEAGFHKDSKNVTLYAAPLATEILERLPKVLWRKVKNMDTNFFEKTLPFDLIITHNELFYVVQYMGRQGIQSHKEQDKNPCNALAKMWIFLKKEGLSDE